MERQLQFLMDYLNFPLDVLYMPQYLFPGKFDVILISQKAHLMQCQLQASLNWICHYLLAAWSLPSMQLFPFHKNS